LTALSLSLGPGWRLSPSGLVSPKNVLLSLHRKGYDSAMSDQPVTRSVLTSVLTSTLAKFHQEVIVPDIQRIVGDAVSGSEARLRNEMQGFHDSILKKLGDLETESAAIKIGLKRVEDRLELVETRLGRVEDRLEKVEARLDRVEDRLDKVGQRLDSVENALRRLEERLSRVEKQIDEIAEPQPGLRSEVQQLKAAIERLQGRIDALEQRAKR
jgi:archaellum component FlaC